jgi:ABC-type multidrug transport system fused ATPase/permease subunit
MGICAFFKNRFHVFSKIKSMNDFLIKIDVKISVFIFVAILSLFAALFEGVFTTLLIPFTEGILRLDYNFVKTVPVLKDILAYLPAVSTIPNTSIFVMLLLMIVLAAIIKNLLQYAACITVAYQVRRSSSNIRKLIFARYLSFDKSFYDRSNIGYLSNVLIGFPNTIANYLIWSEQTLNTVFMFAVYIILMFVISWKLTLFTILIFPILNYSVRSLIFRIKHTSSLYADSQNKINKYVIDILSCINLVKAYTREEQERGGFSKTNETLAHLEFSIDKRQNLIVPVQEIIMLMVSLLLVSIVALIIVKGRASRISDFIVYFYIIKRSTTAFSSLNNFKSYIAVISGPISEIGKVFDDEGKSFVSQGSRVFSGLQKNIEIRNLNFSYPGNSRQVLKDINLLINKHRITAVVGPSGSGKTTLINLIMRFYEIPPSTIMMDGIDIREFTLQSLRSHIALVTQDTLLFNDTIKNNLTYGLDDVPEERIIDSIKKARLYDFIMSLQEGLETYIGDRGVRLSGGEKQRVSIARALLKKAEILILDEATSALDTRTERLIQEAIDEALVDRTAIVIAHRLSTIKNADNIIVIENGELVEAGSLEGLLEKKGRFYEYWKEQKFY